MSKKPLFMAVAALSLFISAPVQAQHLAFTTPVQPGNQNLAGALALGVDFNATAAIVVTAVCAFDANGDSFTNAITGAIYSRSTGVLLAGTAVTFTAANPGILINGHRCIKLADPGVVLAPGQYSAVTTGYGAPDLNGNSACTAAVHPTCIPGNPYSGPTVDTAGGAIAPAGYRFGPNPNPTIMTADLPTTTYLAGSFSFSVLNPPVITKTFSPSTVFVGQVTRILFTISNANDQAITAAFTDALPTGLVSAVSAATPTVISGCGLPTINAAAGATLVSVSGATIAPNGSCTIRVPVLVTGSAVGTLINTTSAVASLEAGNGNTATATLTVMDATADRSFQSRFFANLNVGESYISITNTGANGAPLLGPGFGAAVGNICVNVYAFSPDEQLVSCCSCLVTPNGLVNLGVIRDLTSKTLTGAIPTSLIVKMVATLAGAGGSGTTCSNSAAAATAASVVPGMLAWGTTIHNAPAAMPAYRVTETPFSPASLSAGELSSITARCAAILGNGSGFGVCRSCQAGALGASHSF